MENASEYYYERLKNDNKPGVVLANLYCNLYKIKTTRSEIMMFNKLLQTFGRYTVFFSVLDAFGSYPDQADDPYPLIYAICKSRFEKAHNNDFSSPSRESLDRIIKGIDKEIEELKGKKIKIPSSEGLNVND